MIALDFRIRGFAVRLAAPRLDMLVVPGGFWVDDLPARITHLQDRGVPVRAVVYDVLPLAHPEWFQPIVPPLFGEGFDRVIPRCDRVVVFTEDVRTYLETRYPGIAGRVRVAVPSLEAHRPQISPPFDRNPRMPGRYLLALGTLEPRKNHRLILDAWTLAKRDSRLADAYLAVVGSRGWNVDDIEDEIRREGHRLQIVRIEGATDEQVESLYADCEATVHASWAEGWGLPARESVARGIRTLMSSRIPLGGLPIGSYAVFDPSDPDELAKMMVEVLVSSSPRVPIPPGGRTGWEPIISALLD